MLGRRREITSTTKKKVISEALESHSLKILSLGGSEFAPLFGHVNSDLPAVCMHGGYEWNNFRCDEALMLTNSPFSSYI